MKIGLMGLALGLVIGGGAVLLVELLDTSFKRVEDVEEVLGVKVLATVPKIENLKLR
jgi:capsular polysaccharide biosynthesis protein